MMDDIKQPIDFDRGKHYSDTYIKTGDYAMAYETYVSQQSLSSVPKVESLTTPVKKSKSAEAQNEIGEYMEIIQDLSESTDLLYMLSCQNNFEYMAFTRNTLNVKEIINDCFRGIDDLNISVPVQNFIYDIPPITSERPILKINNQNRLYPLNENREFGAQYDDAYNVDTLENIYFTINTGTSQEEYDVSHREEELAERAPILNDSQGNLTPAPYKGPSIAPKKSDNSSLSSSSQEKEKADESYLSSLSSSSSISSVSSASDSQQISAPAKKKTTKIPTPVVNPKKRPAFGSTSPARGSVNKVPKRGGMLEEENLTDCNGLMVIEDNPDFLQLFREKLEQEFYHDFTKSPSTGFSGDILDKFKFSYSKILPYLSSKTPKSKIRDFAEKIKEQSQNSANKEWIFYINVLEYIDEECDRLEELTIIKYCKISKIPPQNRQDLIEQGYIITIPDPVTDEQKQYFMLTMENKPIIEPMFKLSDFQLGYADNSAPFKMIAPLLFSTNGTGQLVTVPDDVGASMKKLLNSIFTLYYAPGMIDPKTVGGVSMSSFWIVPFDTEVLPNSMTSREFLKYQINQDINFIFGDKAKKTFIAGINSFFKYFNSSVTVEDAEFIVSTHKGTDINNAVKEFNDYKKATSQQQMQLPLHEYYNKLLPELNKIVFSNNDTDYDILEKNIGQINNFYYFGVRITVKGSNGINSFLDFVIGDNTIANIRKVVNSMGNNDDFSQSDSFSRITTIINFYWNNLDKTTLEQLNERFKPTVNFKPPVNFETGFKYIICIALKSLGDALQVNYVRRMTDYFKELNTTIIMSSTDKNTGAECLLYDCKLFMARVGIRPHEQWNEKYPEFFNNPEISPTSDTITTNVSLINEAKYMESIIFTYNSIKDYINNIREFFEEQPLVVEAPSTSMDTEKYTIGSLDQEDSELKKYFLSVLDVLSNCGILKDDNNLKHLLDEYNNPKIDKKQSLVVLKKIDGFIKKLANAVKYCQVPEDGQGETTSTYFNFDLLIQQIKTFNAIELATALSNITLVWKYFDLAKITSIINKNLTNVGNKEYKLTNIFDVLVPFVKENMAIEYEIGLKLAKEKYQATLTEFKSSIINSLRVLEEEEQKQKAQQPNRPKRATESNFSKNIIEQKAQAQALDTSLTKVSQTRLAKLRESIVKAQTELSNYQIKISSGLTKIKSFFSKTAAKTSAKMSNLNSKLDELVKSEADYMNSLVTKHKNKIIEDKKLTNTSFAFSKIKETISKSIERTTDILSGLNVFFSKSTFSRDETPSKTATAAKTAKNKSNTSSVTTPTKKTQTVKNKKIKI